LLSLVRYFRYNDSETLPKSNQRIWTQSCWLIMHLYIYFEFWFIKWYIKYSTAQIFCLALRNHP